MGERERRADFAERLRADHSRLYAFIHSLVRDFDDADDVFQQATIVMWKKFGEYDQARPFFPWACGVARFEAMNFLRSRGRQHLYFSDDLNLQLVEAFAEVPADEMESRRDALAGCVAKLRERDRLLLRECYGDASGVTAAATQRGRSSHSVYNSLRRIRRALYECIERTLAGEVR